MPLTKEQAKNRRPRRKSGSLVREMEIYLEHAELCKRLGLAILQPSPISLRQPKRKRRTRKEMENATDNA